MGLKVRMNLKRNVYQHICENGMIVGKSIEIVYNKKHEKSNFVTKVTEPALLFG